MLTVEQAKEYLDTVGVTLPAFLLTALVEQVNSINECLEANYSPATALLIQCYLLGLLGLAQGDKYISSQTAPSGASRSFRYLSFADRWGGLSNLLRGLDKHNCTGALVPSDPTKKNAGLWVSRGGCYSGRR